MKRKAFTLMEILLTIGIIGIVASLMIRVITGIMPDVVKARFLRAYTATKIIVYELINDNYLYPDTDITAATYGFANTTGPTLGLYAGEGEFSGKGKFRALFSDKLGLNSEGYSTRDNVTYDISDIAGDGSHTVTYKSMVNGVEKTLGSAKIAKDGGITCQNSTDYSYCGSIEEMADLKRQMEKGSE